MTLTLAQEFAKQERQRCECRGLVNVNALLRHKPHTA
jgi:hypothetical protein